MKIIVLCLKNTLKFFKNKKYLKNTYEIREIALIPIIFNVIF